MMEAVVAVPPCDCKRKFEEAVEEQVKKKHPEATGVGAVVGGYVFLLTGGERPALPVHVTYQVPKAKGGGNKLVSKKMSAIASFCPFCGERYPVRE